MEQEEVNYMCLKDEDDVYLPRGKKMCVTHMTHALHVPYKDEDKVGDICTTHGT